MFSRFFVYPCFSFFLVIFLLSQNTKKTKNIFFVSLGLFLCFLALVFLFSLFVFSFSTYFKKSKTPKIFVFRLWFCKVLCRVRQSSLGFGFMLLFKPHK